MGQEKWHKLLYFHRVLNAVHVFLRGFDWLKLWNVFPHSEELYLVFVLCKHWPLSNEIGRVCWLVRIGGPPDARHKARHFAKLVEIQKDICRNTKRYFYTNVYSIVVLMSGLLWYSTWTLLKLILEKLHLIVEKVLALQRILRNNQNKTRVWHFNAEHNMLYIERKKDKKQNLWVEIKSFWDFQYMYICIRVWEKNGIESLGDV